MPSEFIEPVQFSEPRAVQVRAPGNVSEIHSAVSGTIAVYAETKLEADAVLAAWPVIMQKAADAAKEILEAARNQVIANGLADGLDFPND